MLSLSNGRAPADHMRALVGFAALLARHDQGFALEEPLALDGLPALTMGAWALGLDQSTLPSQQFGEFAQCHPAARCVGCVPFCRAESAAVDLSLRANGRPALWLEAHGLGFANGRVSVRTFVPRHPGLSGVWMPALCGMTGQMVLICTKRAVSAQLLPCGSLSIRDNIVPGDVAAMGVWAFLQAWAAVIARPPAPSCGRQSLIQLSVL